MLLGELPNELLRMVVHQLSPEDRFVMRQTSRKFHELANVEGIFLMNPGRIFIDFLNQGLVAFRGDFDESCGEAFAIVNGTMKKKANGRFRAYCDVEDEWVKYVEKYIRNLNEHYKQKTVKCSLHVILPTRKIPDQLLQFSVNFETMHIQTNHARSVHDYPLPLSLEQWMLKTGSSTMSATLDCSLTPSQLDNITAPTFSCSLKDESALHILNKLLDKRLPEDLILWHFQVEANPATFLDALESLGAYPEDEETILIDAIQVWAEIKPKRTGAAGFYMTIGNSQSYQL